MLPTHVRNFCSGLIVSTIAFLFDVPSIWLAETNVHRLHSLTPACCQILPESGTPAAFIILCTLCTPCCILSCWAVRAFLRVGVDLKIHVAAYDENVENGTRLPRQVQQCFGEIEGLGYDCE